MKRRATEHQAEAALIASPALRELALLARSRLRRYSSTERRRMEAACLVETLDAIDAGGIQFRDEAARGTLNALLLVSVDRLVQDD